MTPEDCHVGTRFIMSRDFCLEPIQCVCAVRLVDLTYYFNCDVTLTKVNLDGLLLFRPTTVQLTTDVRCLF